MKFKANHDYGASRWLLQFGASAEVLSPIALREQIHLQLKAAASQYER